MIKKQKALIVGGSNGIGLALAMRLVKEKSVLIVDKVEPDYSQVPSDIKHLVSFRKFDLLFDDYSLFDEFNDIDTFDYYSRIRECYLFLRICRKTL